MSLKTQRGMFLERDVVLYLFLGALPVATVLTLFAVVLELVGVSEFFPGSTAILVVDVVNGWVLLVLVITVLAYVFQWLSYRTPIPPVVVEKEVE